MSSSKRKEAAQKMSGTRFQNHYMINNTLKIMKKKKIDIQNKIRTFNIILKINKISYNNNKLDIVILIIKINLLKINKDR